MELIGQLVYCKHVGSELVFWEHVLGLNRLRTMEVDGKLRVDILVGKNSGQVVALTDYPACADYENVLMFLSDNCIEDVNFLKKCGARALEQLQYSSAGLSAKLADRAGNLLIIIEERQYPSDEPGP